MDRNLGMDLVRVTGSFFDGSGRPASGRQW